MSLLRESCEPLLQPSTNEQADDPTDHDWTFKGIPSCKGPEKGKIEPLLPRIWPWRLSWSPMWRDQSPWSIISHRQASLDRPCYRNLDKHKPIWPSVGCLLIFKLYFKPQSFLCLTPPPSHPPTHPIGAEMDITVATATVVCLLPIRWTCRSNPWVDNKESGEEGAAFF